MEAAAGGELAPRQLEALVAFLLSPAASTEQKRQGAGREAEGASVLTEDEFRKALEAHVPNVSFMLDRTGCTPVADFMWGTYQRGLPIYARDRVLQQHTVQALRYIFTALLAGVAEASAAVKRLAEAYQSCQAEQGRTIDALYGKLIGRDASFRDQVLVLVDSFKSLTLEGVVHKLNPSAAGMGDHAPSRQAPHITSAYLEAVGVELGMRGVAAASQDQNRPRQVQRGQVLDAFREQFNVSELAGAIVSDVNQQAADAERVIDRDLLAKWAHEASGAGFEAHSIYFDEERAGEYDGRPEKEGEHQPFLNRRVALQVLAMLLVPEVVKAPVEESGPPPLVTPDEQQRLLTFLLSPAALTERREPSQREAPDLGGEEELTEEQVLEVLQRHVPNVSSMLDRTGCTPVAEFMWMTYCNGLPIYSCSEQVQEHTIRAIRFIFHAAVTGSPVGGPAALQRLAEAYQSCQAEQGRTIDALYGKLTGRDATIHDQVLALVDSLKALTLEAVVHKLNPDAAGMGDECPNRQAPHITSAYLEAVGSELGMRGVEAARNDENRPRRVNRGQVLASFRELFSLRELADALLADVNQQAADAERVVDRDLLAKWASTAGRGFNPHSIYFEDERASDFDGRPQGNSVFQPFLSQRVAMNVLAQLFVRQSAAPAADEEPQNAAAKPLAPEDIPVPEGSSVEATPREEVPDRPARGIASRKGKGKGRAGGAGRQPRRGGGVKGGAAKKRWVPKGAPASSGAVGS